jgi:hypothetical protein
MAFTKKTKTPTTTKKTKTEKTHFEIFSKSRGYLCSAVDENAARDALTAMFEENQKHWLKQISEGKRWKRCDVYCLCRQGNKSWELPFFFNEEDDEEEFVGIDEGNQE